LHSKTYTSTQFARWQAFRAMEETPDSPLFLQINAAGLAKVWVEVQDLVSPHPTLYYRQDRSPTDSLAVTFELAPDVVKDFAVGFVLE
jgi:hypothetical protein